MAEKRKRKINRDILNYLLYEWDPQYRGEQGIESPFAMPNSALLSRDQGMGDDRVVPRFRFGDVPGVGMPNVYRDEMQDDTDFVPPQMYRGRYAL